MRILPGPTKSNQVLAWSPCERWLVAAGSGDGVTAWDVDADAPGRRVLGSAHGGRLMQFHPTNGRLYVAFQSGGLWDWHPDTGEEREHTAVGSDRFFAMALNSDGRTLVLSEYRRAHSDSGGNYFDVGYAIAADGRAGDTWAREEGRWGFSSYTFRPGTDELFGIGVQDQEEVRFVRVRASDGAVLGSLPLPSGGVSHWVLSPDGERVAWISERGLHVAPADGSGAPLVLPAAEGELRRGLAWSPDGRLLSYTTGPTVRLLDSSTLAELRALDWNIGKPRAVAFHPDGLRAAVSGDGGRGWVTVFDLE